MLYFSSQFIPMYYIHFLNDFCFWCWCYLSPIPFLKIEKIKVPSEIVHILNVIRQEHLLFLRKKIVCIWQSSISSHRKILKVCLAIFHYYECKDFCVRKLYEGHREAFITFIYLFYAIGPFPYPLKISENFFFSEVFRGVWKKMGCMKCREIFRKLQAKF